MSGYEGMNVKNNQKEFWNLEMIYEYMYSDFKKYFQVNQNHYFLKLK